MNKIKVRVPATSANLGSGFDCTGVAFRRYNVLSFEKTSGEIIFENFNPEFSNEQNLAFVGYRKVCERIGVIPAVKIKNIKTEIPISRGLGSSAALIVAGAYAANVLCGKKLTVQEVFEICTKIEGHPDNIAPALFGGLCTSIVEGDTVISQKYTVSDKICFTALVPDFKVQTSDARAALPQIINRKDAIYNMQRIALLPYAFEHGRLDLIKFVTGDRLHEQYRKELYKNFSDVEKIALEEGALAITVSGAGPVHIAYSEIPIAEKIKSRIQGIENNWVALGLSVDNEGTKEIYDEQ